MANWTDLKAAVAAVIKTNGTNAITGVLLQTTLNSIIDNLGLSNQYRGRAIPDTNPGTPDGNMFYIAIDKGTYSNFSGIVIDNNGFYIIKSENNNWVLEHIFDEHLTHFDVKKEYFPVEESQITISNNVITIPKLRRNMPDGTFAEMQAPVTFNISSLFDYFIAKIDGFLVGSISKLVIEKGQNQFFWQEPVKNSQYDVVVFSTGGFFYSKYASIQACFLNKSYALHGYGEDQKKTLKEVEFEFLDQTSVLVGTYTQPTAEFGGGETGFITSPELIEYNGIIKKIHVDVVNTGTYQFAVATLDQFNKAIVSTRYNVALNAGENNVLIEIPVFTGQRLLMKISSGNTKYFHSGGSGIGPNFLYSETESVALHYLADNVNYGGGIPFTYTMEKRVSPFAFKEELYNVKADVATLKNKTDVIVLSRLGVKYKLIVDANENPALKSLNYKNVLCLGNSITKHDIMPFWWGLWGMAATERSKDWVHVLQSKLQVKEPTAVCNGYNVVHYGMWEQNHGSTDLSLFDQLLVNGTDLVVLRLGENVAVLTNYTEHLLELMDYIWSKLPSVDIILAGEVMDANVQKDAATKAAADARGVPFIDLSYMWGQSQYLSNVNTQVYGDDNQWHTISDGGDIAPGVAAHPGDIGHEAIANSIFEIL
jgi:hypothetical protein